MNNQKYQYSYNINESANEEDFFVCCKLIEKNLPGVKKEKLLIDVEDRKSTRLNSVTS